MANRKKDIEANPIVYGGLIYVPTPGNLSSCIFEAFSEQNYFPNLWKDNLGNVV